MKKTQSQIILFLTILFIVIVKNPIIVSAQDYLLDNNYQTEKAIEVIMHKKDSTYIVQSLDVTLLPYPYHISDQILKGKAYTGNIISFLGKSLGYFTANDVILTICSDKLGSDGKMTGGCEDVPEGDVLVRMPYFNNGKYADIYDPDNKKILTIDLSSKATCNENNICEPPIEDSLNCASDCTNGEPVINTSPAVQHIDTSNTSGENNIGSSSVSPDQNSDQSQAPVAETPPWWKSHLVLIGLILAGILLILWFLKGLI
jgi:hypothetical protein